MEKHPRGASQAGIRPLKISNRCHHQTKLLVPVQDFGVWCDDHHQTSHAYLFCFSRSFCHKSNDISTFYQQKEQGTLCMRIVSTTEFQSE
jgi:hypothetical protein